MADETPDPARKRQPHEHAECPDSKRAKHAESAESAPPNVVCLDLLHGLLDPGLAEFTPNIAHQVNATGTKPGGLAKPLVQKFRFADVWEKRKEKGTEESLLGTVRIDTDPTPEQHRNPVTVYSLYAQRNGGKPGKHDDSSAHRELYFARALADLQAKAPDLASIAFPENIGCGIGGGDWPRYQAMIRNFAEAMPNCAVFIVRCERLNK